MNKRFSTLLATALVAGGLSSTVMAQTAGTLTDLKGGEFIQLSANSGNFVLVDDATDGLKFVAKPVLTGADGALLEDINKTLWLVTVDKKGSVAGTTTTFKFTNKATGDPLAVKLETNKKSGANGIMDAGASSKTDKIAGNTVWAWDATKGLYALENDSVFYFGTLGTVAANSVFSLQSAKAENINDATVKVVAAGSTVADNTFAAVAPAQYQSEKIDLSVAQFNKVLKDGKLYFNGQDVSSTEKNVLTDNSWKALPFKANGQELAAAETTEKAFFLTNGETVKVKDQLGNANTVVAGEQIKTKFLLVDYSFYDASADAPSYNKLVVDTVGYEPVFEAETDKLTVSTTAEARSKFSKYTPLVGGFSAEYYVANDSIVLKAVNKPTSISVATTLTTLGTAVTTEVNSTALASLTQLVSIANKFAEAANVTHDAGTLFTSLENIELSTNDWSSWTTGSVKTAELIKAVEEYVATLDSETDAAKIKAVNAYLDGIKGLKIAVKGVAASNPVPAVDAMVSTDKFVNNKNFKDGVNALVATAATNGELVLRQLSNTKVLTVSNNEAGDIALLVQPYATKPGIAGDAEIAEGLYYVVDKEKGAKNDSKTFGLFYDMTPVKGEGAQFAAEGQAFNPFTQYVVEKAAGVEKGNYVITNRGTAKDGFNGVTNVVDKDNKIYAIGGDTIQLVKADDVDADATTIGFKYITEAEAHNNKFTITSAADVLEGYSLVMRSDSSVAVAEADEVLYTLVPSDDDEKYGFDEELIRKTYKIMNADSAYLIKDAGEFVFSNGKYGKNNGTPVEFSLIAVDSESTYVLAYLNENSTLARKMVISTQYKTISTEELGHARNDLFFVTPEAAPASYKSLPKHVQIMGVDGNYMAVNLKNQGVAVREGDELKAAYATEDFTFWLDTADYTDAVTYTYYITKGVKATEEAEASRLFLFNAKDSLDGVSEANKDLLTYGNNGARAIFRTASILAKDTLLVPQLDATAKIDTVSSEAGESVDGLEHDVIAKIDNFKFAFEYTNNEGEYVIKSNGSFVHNINGVLVMGAKEDALVVNVKDADAPTSNEGVEVSEMTIIAGEGNVTIAGAAGKKVVISNILGQVVANTVLSSDNATIAAPAGVVVVAVEGEEAVKAIVK